METKWSLNAIASSIFRDLNGGRPSTDSRFSLEQIKDRILHTRAELASKVLANSSSIPSEWMQECCLDIDCEEICESGIVRQVAKLPSPLITVPGRNSIGFLGTVEGRAFKRGNGGNNRKYHPFAFGHMEEYNIVGDVIHFFNLPKGMNVVFIRAMFVDVSFCKECSSLAMPVPEGLINTIITRVLNFFTYAAQRAVDKNNNTSPDV